MRNSVAKKHKHAEHIVSDNVEESWVVVAKRHQLIVMQAEAACHLEGNMNCPDYDLFEEKYGLICFA